MSDCTELIPIYDQRCLTINAPGHDWSYDTTFILTPYSSMESHMT